MYEKNKIKKEKNKNKNKIILPKNVDTAKIKIKENRN